MKVIGCQLSDLVSFPTEASVSRLSQLEGKKWWWLHEEHPVEIAQVL